jgi:lipoate-protein ligase A
LSPGWRVEHATGTAADFHHRPLPDPAERAVWVFEVERPALVLGSAQPDSVVDHDRARREGVQIVRRRSGGGAVLVRPGECLWVDVVLPRHDLLWVDDVGRSSLWLGDAWVAALRAFGVSAAVHRGPMIRSPWSSLVCFAGLAPGEVTVEGAKAVGISQRRTRSAARFQCAALLRWDARELLRLLDLDDRDRDLAAADIEPRAAAVSVDTRRLITSLLKAVGEALPPSA